MHWTEQETKSRQEIPVTSEKAASFDQTKAEALPTLEKQADRGQMPVEPVKRQPVRSPGIYEGEFMVKDGDIIFHFWPYGFHEAQEKKLAAPRFRPGFAAAFKNVLTDAFGANRIETSFDQDMGAFFGKAMGWGKSQFHFDLSVAACQKLHKQLGGEG